MTLKKTVKNIVCFVALSCVPAAAFAQAAAKVGAGTAPTAAPVAYCAVTGEKIGDIKNANATRTVAGKTYYTCCPGCLPKFDAAPAKYAKIADLREDKRGLEAKLMQVNAELKAAEAAPVPKKTAVAAPVKSAAVFCAVTGESIASAKDAFASQEYNSKTYYLCCAGCVPAFKANPAKYAAAADKRATDAAAKAN
ncbi:MAG: hypothetical protein H7Y38_10020 [Armatimonadetes bacterium]|nr:hypothetical protein [Armatimonadota bacterium]